MRKTGVLGNSGELPGVKSSKTSYADQKVEVEFDPNLVDTQQMVVAIQSEGYEATP